MSISDPPPQQRDLGAIVVGLDSALLFISLLLHWYEPGRSAWTVFEVWDLVLAALAVTGLAAALARLGVLAERWERWMAWSAGLAFVIELTDRTPVRRGGAGLGGLGALLRHRRASDPDEQPTRPHARDATSGEEADAGP